MASESSSDFVVPGYLDMLNEIARLLKQPDLAKQPETERARLLIDALAPAQALLILDNLESLPKDQQNRLFEFLSQLPPGCKAIATSRRRTDVDARIIRLAKLDQDAALALIAELAIDRPLLANATRKSASISTRRPAAIRCSCAGSPASSAKAAAAPSPPRWTSSAAPRRTMTRWSSSSAICWRPSPKTRPKFSPRSPTSPSKSR